MYRSRYSSFPLYAAATLVLSAVLVSHAGCVGKSRTLLNDGCGRGKRMQSELVKLGVEVSTYQPDSLHDDYIDGTSRSYDITTLTVIAPSRIKGRQLSVVHAVTPAADSIWVEVGRRYVVEMDSTLACASGVDLNPDAITILSIMSEATEAD